MGNSTITRQEMKTQLINLFLLMKRMKCHSKGCQLPIWLVLLLVNVGMSAVAQSPARFPFQASVAGANGSPLANRTLNLRISLRDSATNGTLLYRETHAITTNAFGLFDVEIGGGVPVSGQITAINWAVNPKFIQTELDSGTGSWITLATTQLMSHPYALYAQTGGNGTPAGAADGQVLTLCDGRLLWTTGGVCAEVASLGCSTIAHNGSINSISIASGINSVVPYTGGNGQSYLAQSIPSTGVTGLSANLAAGTLANGSGNLTLNITGNPTTNGTASFAFNFGGQSCVINRVVSLPTVVLDDLNCNAININGILVANQQAANVNLNIPCFVNQSGVYSSQLIASTGVTGLFARLESGLLLSGTRLLSLSIIGTPAQSGIANFNLNVGGRSCNISINVLSANNPFYPENSIYCANGTTQIIEVISPISGRIWMDRNLGALRRATSRTDTMAFGDLYQWGRRSDGHQCRTSTTTTTLSSTDQPSNGNFILVNSGNFDWRSTPSISLWQGINGVNNPCPSGFRLPTSLEFEAERISWTQNNSLGAFESILKFPQAGNRLSSVNGGGNFLDVGVSGSYWSSDQGNFLLFSINTASINGSDVARGRSVRCIKEIDTTIGTVGAINCSDITGSRVLVQGETANGVQINVFYTGGNGGPYSSQNVVSNGVSGLTASLSSGNFSVGSGNLIYLINGVPTTSGNSTFFITLGGQACTTTVSVFSPPTDGYPAGTIHCGGTPTAIVEVTNPTTGRIWMDRNLGATRAATSSTDAQAYGDLYQWGRRADGHQCRNSVNSSLLNTTDQPYNGNFVIRSEAPFDWRITNNDNLWQGINGVNNPCPSGFRIPTEVELNLERLSWNSRSDQGAFLSSNKFTLPGFRDNSGQIVNTSGQTGYYWSSSTNGMNAKFLDIHSIGGRHAYINFSNRAIGLSVRCIKDIKDNQDTISSLNCAGAVNMGVLNSGISSTAVSSTISYFGGNGGVYNGQSINSSGVIGLTANLPAGTLANGAGDLNFIISGTPNTSGVASFLITIGGKSCILNRTVDIAIPPTYPLGTVFCDGIVTSVVEVVNPETGRIWMDRNLGASQAATSSTDAQAYGDLYQWGRRADGHQCRTSSTTSTLSSTDQPAHGNFILAPNSPWDWRSPQNNNLWQGVNGVNNPCPSGFRLPTNTELDAERTSWGGNQNSNGAIASPLKLPMAGSRSSSNGSLFSVGSGGSFWSSTVSGAFASALFFRSSHASMSTDYRAFGFSVRCLKD